MHRMVMTSEGEARDRSKKVLCFGSKIQIQLLIVTLNQTFDIMNLNEAFSSEI